MPKRSLRIRPEKIRLIIDKPVETKSYTEENRRELIDKVKNIIIKNYDEWREAGTASIRDIEKENS